VADLADESRAAEVAQRLITAMQRDFSFDGHNLMLGVSIGIAVHPFDGSDVATMLQAADRAMYRAKLSGGNAYQFNSADAAETVTI
jgi:FOG: GGDEF domain